MEKTIFVFALLSLLLNGCKKNDDGQEGGSAELPYIHPQGDICNEMDDPGFKAYCYEHFDLDNDGKVTPGEAEAVIAIDGLPFEIVSLKGIERFANLEKLVCDGVVCLTTLDLRYNLKLRELSCNNCLKLTRADLRGTALETINFGYCPLTEIHLPESLTAITQEAFIGNLALPELKLPAGVAEIGEGAFAHCESLTHIDLPAALTRIESAVFHSCGLTELVVPERVTTIGKQAFAYCARMEYADLPAALTEIEEQAFLQCQSMERVICRATTPPAIRPATSDLPAEIPTIPPGIRLYVQAEHVKAYENSAWQDLFAEILPIE